MDHINSRMMQPYRFIGVGAFCALLANALVWAFSQLLHLHYLLAFVLAFFTVNYAGFMLNKFFTFQIVDTAPHAELSRYYIAMAVSLLLNLTCLYVLVDVADMSVFAACLLLTLVFPPMNYLAHKVWTFRAATNGKP